MSNFFTKTKGDMKYLTKKTAKLTAKGRRRKKSARNTLIGLILVFIQIILMVLFLLKIFKLDLLPVKYIIMLNVILILLALYNFMSQFTRAHIIGKLLSVLMSVVMLFGFIYAAQLDAALSMISGITTKTDVVDVIVLSSDKAESIKDAKGYSYGYNKTVNSTVTTKALSDIESDNNTTLDKKSYNNWDDLTSALYANKDVQAMILTDSVRSTLSEQYPDFESKTKVIGSIKITTEVKLSASDKKVNEEPFIIYLSGNDGYGDISSTGRSDVNILAVINPKTRQVLLVSTPRDYYINISDADGHSGLDKLTHAGNAGIEYSISALENLYGVSVDYYFKINFTGCVDVVNSLGGITINSDVAFTNGLEAAPEKYTFTVGENECDGEKTLAFVRERKAFADGDFQRGRNQSAAIKAIIDKGTSPAILSSYSSVLDAVSSMVLTNMPTTTMTALIKGQVSNSTAWNVQSYSASGKTGSKNGQVYNLKGMSVVTPDDTSVNTGIDLINKTINGETFNVDDYAK